MSERKITSTQVNDTCLPQCTREVVDLRRGKIADVTQLAGVRLVSRLESSPLLHQHGSPQLEIRSAILDRCALLRCSRWWFNETGNGWWLRGDRDSRRDVLFLVRIDEQRRFDASVQLLVELALIAAQVTVGAVVLCMSI